MSAIAEVLPDSRLRQRSLADIPSDLRLVRKGILDWRSFISGHRAHKTNVIGIEVRDAKGRLKALRYTTNLRTNVGGSWQANDMAGGAHVGETGTATSTTATSLTNTGAAWATNQYAGQLVVAGGVYGVIVSNTATVLTIDEWYAPATPGGTAGATPSGTTTYLIPAGQAAAWWVCLSTDATAPSTADTAVAGEITTNGLARAWAGGTGYTLTAPTGTGSTTNTFSYTLVYTWTASGSETAVQKSGILTASNSTAAGILVFENTFTSVNLASGDTLQLTWTITG